MLLEVSFTLHLLNQLLEQYEEVMEKIKVALFFFFLHIHTLNLSSSIFFLLFFYCQALL